MRLAGLVAAFGYLAVLLLTRLALPGASRPLYDGFAPPAPYRWVNPPRQLRDTNSAPVPGTGHVDRSDGADASLAFQTGDQQASVTADLAALGLTSAETGADGTLTPLDPTAYAALPNRAPSGNVYRLTVTARPSGRAVTTFAGPVSLSLILANTAGTEMYASPDGRAWTLLQSTTGQPYVVANIKAPGYFVLGGPAGLLPTIEPPHRPSHFPWALVVAGAVAVLVAGGVALLLRRRA